MSMSRVRAKEPLMAREASDVGPVSYTSQSRAIKGTRLTMMQFASFDSLSIDPAGLDEYGQ